jgi:hypothetical protein
MSVRLLSPHRQDLERHMKRLAWFALLACLALLIPAGVSSVGPQLQIAGALAAVVVVVAVCAVLRDAVGYIRAEQVRRREVSDASKRAGACMAADVIQDRVANLLSVTVGYVQFLVEDQRLPPDVREQADKALEGALAAARAVSLFRRSLGCDAEAVMPLLTTTSVQHLTTHSPLTGLPTDTTWTFDAPSRRVTDADGAVIANLAPSMDHDAAIANGRLMAAAPAMWSALAEAQQFGVSLLDGRKRWNKRTEEECRQLLERLNDVSAQLQN